MWHDAQRHASACSQSLVLAHDASSLGLDGLRPAPACRCALTWFVHCCCQLL